MHNILLSIPQLLFFFYFITIVQRAAPNKMYKYLCSSMLTPLGVSQGMVQLGVSRAGEIFGLEDWGREAG